MYKGVHVLDTKVHTLACRHDDTTCCLGTRYKATAVSKLAGSFYTLHCFKRDPRVTSYPSAGTCCVTCQGHCHRYFGGWKGTVVSTPCNPGTKSETEMNTNYVSEPYVKPSKFVSCKELRFLFVYLANPETLTSSLVQTNSQIKPTKVGTQYMQSNLATRN